MRSRVLALAAVVLAGCAGGGEDHGGERFEFADFEGGTFEEPEYRLVHADCPPQHGRLTVRFDPETALVILDPEGELFGSLSAEGAEIGCADAALEEVRGRGWQQRGIAGPVQHATEFQCSVAGPLDFVLAPLFGPGELRVAGGYLIVATPVPGRADRILVSSSYEEDGPASVYYRRRLCRVTG